MARRNHVYPTYPPHSRASSRPSHHRQSSPRHHRASPRQHLPNVSVLGPGAEPLDSQSISQANLIVGKFQQARGRLQKLEKQIMLLTRENTGLVRYLQTRTLREQERRHGADSALARLESDKADLEHRLLEERSMHDSAPMRAQRLRDAVQPRQRDQAEVREMRQENKELRRQCHEWRRAAMETRHAVVRTDEGDPATRETLLNMVRAKQAVEHDMQGAIKQLEQLRGQEHLGRAANEQLFGEVERLKQDLHDTQLQNTLNSQHYNALLQEVREEAENAVRSAEQRCKQFIETLPETRQIHAITKQTDAIMTQMQADLAAANRELQSLRDAQHANHDRAAFSPFSQHPSDDAVYISGNAGGGGVRNIATPRSPSFRSPQYGGGAGGEIEPDWLSNASSPPPPPPPDAGSLSRAPLSNLVFNPASLGSRKPSLNPSVRSDRSRRTFL